MTVYEVYYTIYDTQQINQKAGPFSSKDEAQKYARKIRYQYKKKGIDIRVNIFPFMVEE